MSDVARIAAITHEYDRFVEQRSPGSPKESRFQLFGVLREMIKRGHEVQVVVGPNADVSGDLAILHVDCSLVLQEYVALAERFTRTVNGRCLDITKRATSEALLAEGEDWSGPVIVKSNLNAKGFPEVQHNMAAKRLGQPVPHPDAPVMLDYKVYESLDALPEMAWTNHHLVVEKFIPEPAEDGFVVRNWLFLGAQGRCLRHVASSRLMNAESILRSEPIEVPEELRALREKLGFDFGKFDFVLHEGRAVLIDANKTPGTAANPSVRARIEQGFKTLADGLEALLP